jgi:uncharacterized damage-inducible protein DinB
MPTDAAKGDLHRYLRIARDAVVWKLDGLGEYDVRRPMTPTGTNLLGLVKHLANVESGYFGATFGRPFGVPMTWDNGDAEPDDDMWARADESREDIVDLYQRVCAHADDTITALPLDAPGEVPWWPAARRSVTLHRVLVHVLAETNRHAGHADIVRESIDGAVGLRADNNNLSRDDEPGWTSLRDRVENAAREAGRAR